MVQMVHQFSRVPHAEIQRSSFNRSHEHKTTFDAGYLVPIYVDEVLPGDTFKMNMTGFARLATPIKPVMDNLYMDSFFFFVPNRLVWDNWKKFMGEEDNPGAGDPGHVDHVQRVPTVTFDPTDDTGNPKPENGAVIYQGPGSIFDYFGLPINASGTVTCNALPLRAYNVIYDEWFRDQNLISKQTLDKGDGPDDWYDYGLRRRGKRHDYFTSCLPWPSKNSEAVIPIKGTIVQADASGQPYFSQNANTGGSGLRSDTDGTNLRTNQSIGSSVIAKWGQTTGLEVGEGPGINDLRIAFALQRLLERDARGGTRYTELVKAHFGVTSPDARLQRPEYLGGGSSRVQVSAVAQNAPTTQDSPQGNLAAVGTVALNRHGFTASFTEHGYIIGLVNVRADLTYQEGMNRMWFRSQKYDYYWPALAHIGEQEVFTAELYTIAAGPISIDPLVYEHSREVFGYQERYAEYRYKPSLITGLFRSNHPQSLDVWHLSQDFQNEPALNEDFIEEHPPIDRVIAVQDEPHFIADFHFDLTCVRPLPVYGVPGYVDHF